MERTYQDLSAFRVPKGFRGRSLLAVQLWWIVQALLFRPSPQVCYGWRRFLLRLFGAKVGKKVLVRSSVKITYPWKVSIGEYSQIGDSVVLYSLGHIVIGGNAVVSQGCYICAAGHDPASPTFSIYQDSVFIDDEVWLAAQCFVCPGVRIGHGSFCNVRTLVTKSLPSGRAFVGSPAREVCLREELTPMKIGELGVRQENDG
ncbi:colanic acid biosynthesis acetyltransferase WcaF [Pseudooceanicola lipolyticus]|uniref:Colanic acid biosynthesis acetyltransferase WcaF n=1 Tax=Pseudooceanicola lipolyticus TaxID=2029104 RepID=A0A2M8J075_9RHOB|nr:colanic acid biosynthesis acetyltransferase WcaF [Pseudooceanicola lipolyticus]